MRPFTAIELERMRDEEASTFGDDSGLGFTAVISRIPSGDDPTARTVVVASLACGRLSDMDQREKERVPGMASVSRAFKVKAEVNTSVQRGLRLIYSSRDYLIHYVERGDGANPQFMVLYLVDEGVSA